MTMRLTNENGIWKLEAQSYRLTLPADRPFVYLDDAQGRRLAELFVLSGVQPLYGSDDTFEAGPWEVNEAMGEVILTRTASSTAWQRKVYRLRCLPSRLVYEVEVEGQGPIDRVQYFGGYYSGQPRWGSGFFWSGQHFECGFSPEPNTEETNTFGPGENAVIDMLGVPLPGKNKWFFTPPPFVFGLKGAGGWLGLGVEARMGENRFTEYCYHGTRSGFHLSLSYEGHTQVAGRYTLPAIGFDFVDDEWAAIEAHVRVLQAAGGIPTTNGYAHPDWWYEPIFCGWGAQCYLSALEGGWAPDYSRQENYERFLAELDENDVRPGIVVLDDKWQATYGDNRIDPAKWPDLTGFIAGQHAQGRKVLLWLKAWDAEGLPAEECITNACGLPLAVDPSNPAYEARLRRSVQVMLSPDGYDGDGFKIDFTARIPSGPGICTFGDVWGLELMKRYLWILYDEAKRIKPDALVMTHTPHPYLGDVVDMIRLNDVNTGRHIMTGEEITLGQDITEATRLRYRVAALALPGAIIDTDNWPMKDKATWRRYLEMQPELGVPSLYFTSHLDSTKEPLDAEDYRLIREIWSRHRANRTNGQAAAQPLEAVPGPGRERPAT